MAGEGFKKGHAKVGGRKAGVPNKVNKQNAERIDLFFDTVWDEFINEVYPSLSPKDKKDTIVALMNYRYPKLSSVDVRSTVKQDDSTIGMLAAHAADLSLVKNKK